MAVAMAVAAVATATVAASVVAGDAAAAAAKLAAAGGGVAEAKDSAGPQAVSMGGESDASANSRALLVRTQIL